MSDDEDWGFDNQSKVQEKATPVPEQPSSRGRGRRGQEREVQEAKPNVQSQDDEKAKQKSEQSWIIDENKQSAIEQKQIRRQDGRNNQGQAFQNSKVQEEVSQIVHPDATQLTAQQPPKNQNDSWLDDKADNQKKEQQLKKDTAQNENVGRGNRGNRGNRDRNQQENNTQDFQGNEEPRRGNRGNRDYNRNQNQEGNRDFGRNNRDRNQEGGDRFGGRRERGNWEDRGQRGERGGRGGFRGGDRGGFRGGYNGNRDRNERQERNYGNNRDNRDDRNGRVNRNYNNDRNFNNNQNQSDQKPVVKEQKVQSTNIGSANLRRAWPSCQIYIYGRKLSITLRRVQQFNSKILIVPYRNLKFDYYPGNFVLSSSVSYRQKIVKKGEELQKGGAVYFQKAVGLGNYQAVVFLKIDQSNKQQNLQKGIDYILKNACLVQNQIPLDTLVFPLSKDLCEPIKVLQIFSKCLQTYKTIKQVYITTNEPEIYERSMRDFSKYLMNTIDNNELSLQ